MEKRRAEDDLEAHFSSVQRICDKTALPAVVPRLKYALQSRLDLASQLRMLRAQASTSVTSQQKLEAWENLKILAFTRVTTASLSLAILSLHMRIMLNVLSRQLYLEHALQGTPGRTGWPSLSVEAQESFLGLVEKGFPSAGLENLISAVQQTVCRKVANLQLSKSLTESELRALLMDIYSDLIPMVIKGTWMSVPGTRSDGTDGLISHSVESSETAQVPDESRSSCEIQNRLPCGTHEHRWDSVLLPHDQFLDNLFENQTPNSPSADSSEFEARDSVMTTMGFEMEQLKSMVQEVRNTLRNRRFVKTLEAALEQTWHQMMKETADELYGDDPGKTVAVAKLVPAMSNLSGDFLENPSALLRAVANCDDVHNFTREIW